MTDITNYGTLKAELVSLSKRTDLTTRLVAMVTRAENMVNRNVKALENMATATLDDTKRTGSTDRTYYVPPRTTEVAAIWQGTNPPMNRRTWWELERFSQLRAYHSWAFMGPSTPEAAAPSNEPLVAIIDTPAAGQSFTLQYWYGLPSMAADADTNALLKKTPELYLYAGLYWIAFDAKDFDEAQVMIDLFTSTKDTVNRICERARRSGASPNLINLNHGSSM